MTLNSAYLINLFVNSKAFINISDFFTYTVKLANVQTITEHRRIDAFELWYWRRLLRVPWTARRSNQSILKEISPSKGGIFGRTDVEVESPILWPPDVKRWLI